MGFDKTSFFIDSDKDIKPYRDASIDGIMDISYNKKDTRNHSNVRLYQKGNKLDSHRLSRVIKYEKGE